MGCSRKAYIHLKTAVSQKWKQKRGRLKCSPGSAAAATCLCVEFGTGEGHIWYGICVPCSKRLPEVRDAFSEALGAQNRLLRYGRDILCQKQPPLVRGASSKIRRTADSTDCGQPTAAPDPIFSARDGRTPKVETKKPAEKQRA